MKFRFRMLCGILIPRNAGCAFYHMRKLMAEKTLSRRGMRLVFSLGKNQVLAECISTRIQRARRLRCSLVRVYAHFGKVVAKARLKQGTGGLVQRLAGRVQHLMHDRRGSSAVRASLEFLLLAFLALAAIFG